MFFVFVYSSCDIRYTEGIQSLNWAKIMKTITDDPEDFFDNGGWSFLDANDSDEGEGDEELDEEDEVYDPSASEFDDNEESESEYSDESISEDDSSDGNFFSKGQCYLFILINYLCFICRTFT